MKTEIYLCITGVQSAPRKIALYVFLVMTCALVACTNSVVPADANLKITPSQHSIEIIETLNESGQCQFSENNYLDIPLTITLLTSNGSPIGDEVVSVYTDFSENTYSGYAVLALFDDLNSNGVVDGAVELVSGENDEIFRAETGRYSGTKSLLLRINLSCSFRGEVRVIAGPATANAVIAVNALGALETSSAR